MINEAPSERPRSGYLQLDVFADRPGAGNPLGVVLDGRGWSDAGMQRFAAWTNLSETVFLLPPEAAGASYRVRIFTPRQELPFAGHPSVGSAHAVLESGLATAREGRLLQECKAGLLPVRVTGEGGDRRIFVRAPQARALDLPARVAERLEHVLPRTQRAGLAPALLDNGPRWLCVMLRDEATVRGWAPDLAAVAELTILAGAVGLAVYAVQPGVGYELVVRAFCPADNIPEDPVTGSVNAAIGAWLHLHSALPANPYRASQGRELGRDGVVEVEVDADGEVWIGGRTQTVIRAGLEWPVDAGA
jgi:PhzF family phenazine biosynthesis protein